MPDRSIEFDEYVDVHPGGAGATQRLDWLVVLADVDILRSGPRGRASSGLDFRSNAARLGRFHTGIRRVQRWSMTVPS